MPKGMSDVLRWMVKHPGVVVQAGDSLKCDYADPELQEINRDMQAQAAEAERMRLEQLRLAAKNLSIAQAINSDQDLQALERFIRNAPALIANVLASYRPAEPNGTKTDEQATRFDHLEL